MAAETDEPAEPGPEPRWHERHTATLYRRNGKLLLVGAIIALVLTIALLLGRLLFEGELRIVLLIFILSNAWVITRVAKGRRMAERVARWDQANPGAVPAELDRDEAIRRTRRGLVVSLAIAAVAVAGAVVLDEGRPLAIVLAVGATAFAALLAAAWWRWSKR